MNPRLCSLLLLALPVPAFALGFRIVDHGAEATARAGAFTASADNPSAIYYNPAAITELDGVQLQLNAYSVGFESSVNPTLSGAADFDSKNKWETVGDAYLTWKPKDSPIALGLGVYSPFGLSVEYPEDSVSRTIGQKGRIQFLTVNPVIAFQATKQLSLAFGITANYSRAKLARGLGFTPGDTFQLEGDGYGVGVTAGLLWKPTPQHAFGIRYFGPVDMTYHGHGRTRVPPFPLTVEPVPGVKIPIEIGRTELTQDIDVTLDFPQSIKFGYAYTPTEDWNIELGVEWTDWDNLDTAVVQLGKNRKDPLADRDAPLNFKYQSSFIYEVGITKKFAGGWRASVGYLFSENSVPEQEFSPLVPDSDRHVFSGGVGCRYEHWDWFLSYQYAVSPHRDIDQPTVAAGVYHAQSHAVSLSVGYKF